MSKIRGMVYHNLAVSLGAGLPVVKALRSSVPESGGKWAADMRSVGNIVAEGVTIGEAMGRFGGTFDSIEVQLVRAAELSGDLPKCFETLAQWAGFCRRLSGIFWSGILYPVLLIHMAAFIGPLPLVFMGQKSLGEGLAECLMVLGFLYVPAAVIFFIARFTGRGGEVRRGLDRIVLMIPVLARAVRYLSLGRFCRVFNMLYSSGVDIVETVQTAVNSTGNVVIADRLKGAVESTRQGHLVSEGFSEKLPDEFVQTFRNGEEGGTLDEATERLGVRYVETAEMYFTEFYKWLPRIVYGLIAIYIVKKIMEGYAAIGS